MHLTVTLKLQATQEQSQALLATLRTANEAANEISRWAWQHRTFGQYPLHKLCYHPIRQSFDLSAQVVVRLMAKVAGAYQLDREKRRVFRPEGSIAYDDRILTYDANTVSIWTVAGAGPRSTGHTAWATLVVLHDFQSSRAKLPTFSR